MSLPQYLPGKLVGHPDLLNCRAIDSGCLPLISEMERVGTAINIDHFKKLSTELKDSMREYEDQIKRHIPIDALREFVNAKGTGNAPSADDPDSSLTTSEERDEDLDDAPSLLENFNLNSPEKVAWLLFETLNLGRGKQLATSGDGKRISTGKKQLEMLKSEHEIVGLLLKYREVSKLKTTYTDKLPRIAIKHDAGNCSVCGLWHPAKSWRVHTEFPITRIETGRPACSAYWTPVLTKRGQVQIKDVVVGDYVWTHKHRWRKVTATWTKGISPMFDIRFSNGDILTCTGAHRLLAYNHEHIETLDSQSGSHRRSASNVPLCGLPDTSGDSGFLGDDLPYSTLDLQEQTSRSGVQSIECNPLLPLETRGEEPNVREVRRTASQLAGTGGRWIRVSDLYAQWQAAVRTSNSNGASFRYAGVASQLRYPSYRWEPKEQQSGQLSTCNESRSQDDSFLTTEGQPGLTIEEITYSGRHEVYDITVDADESYLTYSVFSHNSRNPNLQNIPGRTKLGKLVRNGFIPTPGWVWVTADESQIELRSLAHCALEHVMIEIYKNHGDIHIETARKAFGLSPTDTVDKDMHRAPAKTVNFGVVYGMSARGLFAQLVFMFHADGKEVPSWLTEDWCQEFIDKWFAVYPEVKIYMDHIELMVRRWGMVWNQFGRVRQIHGIWSVHKHIVSECLRQAGNMPIQGFAAELMKLWMFLIKSPVEGEGMIHEWRESGPIYPLLTVHDELNFECDPAIAPIVKEQTVQLVEYIGEELGLACPLLAEGDILPYWKK